jgi:hypothetical protein
VIGNDTWNALREIREYDGVKKAGALISHHINGMGGPDKRMEQWWVPFDAMDEIGVQFSEVHEV